MMQAAFILAQAEPEERSGLFLILPEPAELIWGAVSFAVLVFLVWRFVGPALSRLVEARQEAITGRLEEAEKSKHEAESLLADYRQQLAEAKAEANRIIEEARRTAEAMRNDLVEKAEADSEEISRRAAQEVAAERERAMQQLRREMAELSIDLAERVVQQSLDRKAQAKLVDQYLKELEEMKR